MYQSKTDVPIYMVFYHAEKKHCQTEFNILISCADFLFGTLIWLNMYMCVYIKIKASSYQFEAHQHRYFHIFVRIGYSHIQSFGVVLIKSCHCHCQHYVTLSRLRKRVCSHETQRQGKRIQSTYKISPATSTTVVVYCIIVQLVPRGCLSF